MQQKEDIFDGAVTNCQMYNEPNEFLPELLDSKIFT